MSIKMKQRACKYDFHLFTFSFRFTCKDTIINTTTNKNSNNTTNNSICIIIIVYVNSCELFVSFLKHTHPGCTQTVKPTV